MSDTKDNTADNTIQEETPETTQEEYNEIIRVRRNKLKELQESGKDPYEITDFNKTHSSTYITNHTDSLLGQTVSVAGRLMSKRVMGKASFFHILDGDGLIQIYVKRDDVGEEEYSAFKAMDIGDIAGVEGEVFVTRTGETSVHAGKVTLLAKSLLPLPEKFHGLKDPDLRYRQRYVDLIVNPEVRRTFETRSKIIAEIRRFLDGKGFLEVETPLLSNIAGGANARPFITHHNTLDIDLYMRIALELHLKRLVVGGFEKVYEIGRVFRNEGMSVKHNPEFTLLELYQAYTDYNGMMDLTEELVCTIAQNVLGTETVEHQGAEICLATPWARITMTQAVLDVTGIDFSTLTDEEAAVEAKKIGFNIKKGTTRGEILYQVFDERAEHTLLQPTFVTDHPVEISPLAKKKPDQPWLTERFELFIGGREYANAFSELNDPIDQKERFLKQAGAREAGDDEAHMMDEDYVNALEYGMPPTGGLGIGVDRLVMLLTNASSIRDVLLFPTMKPR